MPEITVNEISREARPLYTKGNDAFARENYGYAVTLYCQVLEKQPGFFDCRKQLRVAQARNSGGGGFFKKMISGASSSPQVAKAQLALRKNPTEAMALAEQALNTDPTNSMAHRIIVNAAQAMELPRTAALSLELLHKNSPKDKGVAIEFANALADAGESARGEQVLAEFARNVINDGEVQQALKDLSARKTLRQGGYDALASGEGSYRDILKDSKEAASIEQESRVQKSEDVTERLIGEYEARLKKEPDNLKLVRSLAELYTQKKQFERAFEYYDRVKNSDMGNDPSLERDISETKVRQFDHQLEQLDPKAPDYAEQADKIKADRLAFQVADCQQRVEKYPTDLAIRYEMGALYFQTGKTNEAIQEFQKAQGNPHKRLAAMNYLGQCYGKKKMYDLAVRAFQNAIKEKPVFDEEKKDLVYNLGSVLELMGKNEEAIEQFKQIYEVDFGYKDVAAKVDKYYGSQ